MSGVVTINPDTCDGCGVCVESCPVDVLRRDDVRARAFAAYPRDCQVCFLCQNDCPRGAIRVEPGPVNSRRRSIYDTLGFSADALVFKPAKE